LKLEGLELNSTLKQLVAKIQSNDPYINQLRVGQNRPNVVRLVFDLKGEVTPQVFTLEPVSNYKHRLVFDLYPSNPPDLIAALIEKGEWHKDSQVPNPSLAHESNKDIKSGNLSKQLADAREDDKKLAKSLDTAETSADRNGDKSADRSVDKLADKADPEANKLYRMITIAIDPGHGGEDPGAIGSSGSREKDVVLAIAKRLKAKIEQQPNMRVMLTRDADYFVPLNVRVQKARNVQADLFMSIHADAFVETSARGSSVFVLSEKGASSSAARWLATKENDCRFKLAESISKHMTNS